MCAAKDASTQTEEKGFFVRDDRFFTEMQCDHGVPYVTTAQYKDRVCSICEPDLFPEFSDFADLSDAGFDDVGWSSLTTDSVSDNVGSTKATPPWRSQDPEFQESEDEMEEAPRRCPKGSKATTDAQGTTDVPLSKAKKSSLKSDEPKARQAPPARSSTTRSTKYLKARRKTKESVEK